MDIHAFRHTFGTHLSKAGVTGLNVGPLASAAEQPNIILMMTDDHGTGEFCGKIGNKVRRQYVNPAKWRVWTRFCPPRPLTLDSMAGIITLRVVLWMELAYEVSGEPTRAF